jgi:hypothetical protein
MSAKPCHKLLTIKAAPAEDVVNLITLARVCWAEPAESSAIPASSPFAATSVADLQGLAFSTRPPSPEKSLAPTGGVFN